MPIETRVQKGVKLDEMDDLAVPHRGCLERTYTVYVINSQQCTSCREKANNKITSTRQVKEQSQLVLDVRIYVYVINFINTVPSSKGKQLVKLRDERIAKTHAMFVCNFSANSGNRWWEHRAF